MARTQPIDDVIAIIKENNVNEANKKRERNKKYSMKYRAKRKLEVEMLQSENPELKQENAALKQENAELKQEIAMFKQENAKLTHTQIDVQKPYDRVCKESFHSDSDQTSIDEPFQQSPTVLDTDNTQKITSNSLIKDELLGIKKVETRKIKLWENMIDNYSCIQNFTVMDSLTVDELLAIEKFKERNTELWLNHITDPAQHSKKARNCPDAMQKTKLKIEIMRGVFVCQFLPLLIHYNIEEQSRDVDD